MGGRLEVEKKFHDKKYMEPYKYIPTLRGDIDMAYQYALSLLEPIEGKTILDYGCGEGRASIYFAKRGAYVYGIDISSIAISKAKELAKKHEVEDKTNFEVMNAEALDFHDESFDFIHGLAILHHLDLTRARDEIYRVLKKGGKAVFLEPLGHNPFINLYRKLTPHLRTPTERPLLMRDLVYFSEPFSNFYHKEFYLTALLAVPLSILPNKNIFKKIYNNFAKLDNIIINKCQILRKYAWITVIQVIK